MLIKKPIIQCPHCQDYIEIQELNCCIFRHGIFKETGEQINPHENKNLCDYYFHNKLIYGCGKPFKITLIENKLTVEKCDYI
jgi:hypothetical protein